MSRADRQSLSQDECGQRKGRRRNPCRSPRLPLPGSLGREGGGGEGENSAERMCTFGIDFDPSTDVSYAEACPGTWASLERPTGFFEVTVSKFAAASETSSDNVASHTCGAGG